MLIMFMFEERGFKERRKKNSISIFFLLIRTMSADFFSLFTGKMEFFFYANKWH